MGRSHFGPDSCNHPSPRRAVELGDDESGKPDRVVKFAGLLQHAAAGRAVGDEPGVVRHVFAFFLEAALDLAEFEQEVVFVRLATGSIDDKQISLRFLRGEKRPDGHGGGIGSRSGAGDGDAKTRAPRLELLGGGGAKRVGGAEMNGASFLLRTRAEFRGGCRFAAAIDSNEEDGLGLLFDRQRRRGMRTSFVIFSRRKSSAFSGERARPFFLISSTHSAWQSFHPEIGFDEECFPIDLLLRSAAKTVHQLIPEAFHGCYKLADRRSRAVS